MTERKKETERKSPGTAAEGAQQVGGAAAVAARHVGGNTQVDRGSIMEPLPQERSNSQSSSCNNSDNSDNSSRGDQSSKRGRADSTGNTRRREHERMPTD